MESLNRIVEEAVSLRFTGSQLPEEGQMTPALAQSVLLDVRKRLDRVEELLVMTLRVKGRALRHARALQADVDEEWAKAIEEVSQRRNRYGSDYSGTKERYAEADLKVIKQRRDQQAAQAEADQAQEAYEVVRVCQRGLDTLRQDCVAYLRSLQFESSLER